MVGGTTGNSGGGGDAEPPYSPRSLGMFSQYAHNRWQVFSPKENRPVILYSNLEYDHWALVELNPDIERFCEQPLKIQIKLPVGLVTTTFDMWLRWKSGREEFREVKHESDLHDPSPGARAARQTAAQRRWCELNDKDYTIVTDKIIRSNSIYLSNCKMIVRHWSGVRAIDLTPYCEKVLLRLLNTGAWSLGDIKKCFANCDPLIITSAVFRLVYEKRLKAPLESEVLNLTTMLEVMDATT